MRGYIYLLLLLCLVVLLFIKMPVRKPLEESKGYNDMSVRDLQARLEAGEELLLLDVRESNEFETARIPDACLLPLGQLESKHGLLDRGSKIVVVCRSGNRSSTAAAFLAEQGFSSVYNLVGGMISWPGATEKGEGGCRY